MSGAAAGRHLLGYRLQSIAATMLLAALAMPLLGLAIGMWRGAIADAGAPSSRPQVPHGVRRATLMCPAHAGNRIGPEKPMTRRRTTTVAPRANLAGTIATFPTKRAVLHALASAAAHAWPPTEPGRAAPSNGGDGHLPARTSMRDFQLCAAALAGFLTLQAQACAQATWSRLYPADAPARRTGHAMACAYDDFLRGPQLILFGGASAAPPATLLDDTWRWNGTGWSSLALGQRPSPRRDHAMVAAGDGSSNARIYLFGGRDALGHALGDLWEFRGSVGNWTQLTLGGPLPRYGAAMAWDIARGQLVVFGGRDDNTTGLGGTACYSGTWRLFGTQGLSVPTPSPAARHGAQMVFDPVRGVCTLFGGAVVAGGLSSTILGEPVVRMTAGATLVDVNDTWQWDGNLRRWQVAMPTNMPNPSQQHRMIFDPSRGRTVAHGLGNGDYFTWEWDGQNWSMVLQASPGAAAGAPLAYDSLHSRVVFYGSQFQTYADHGDTWVYSPFPEPLVASFAQPNGCQTSAGQPLLANDPTTWPWIGTTLIMRVSQIPATSPGVYFATGFGSTPATSLTWLGLPVSCVSFVTLDSTEFSSRLGTSATLSVAIPNTNAIAGIEVFQQALALDAAAPGGGAVSNAVRIVVGGR